ncbi:hypothetical protein EDB89DRAFT_1924142 [Lactarius sanguifluus]|nr:hypothetical protein EDB89DRAFT_1924142 [Lactarius sanguifluus]
MSPFPSYFFFCLHSEHYHAHARSSHTHRTDLPSMSAFVIFLFFSPFSSGKSKPPSPPSGPLVNLLSVLCGLGLFARFASFPPRLPSPFSLLYLCSDSAVRPLNKNNTPPAPLPPTGTPLPLLADGLGWLKRTSQAFFFFFRLVCGGGGVRRLNAL